MNIFNTEIQNGLNKTKNFHIYGLSRSGNHAIIFWIIHNLVDNVEHIGNDIYTDRRNKLCFINNVNIQNKFNNYIFSSYDFNYIIRSYEDTYFDDKTTAIILRDFLNLICSRYKKYHNDKHNICLNNYYICDLHYLIQIWKQHTKASNRIILYNEWLVSKLYRDQISKNIIGIENSIDNIKKISAIGGSSTFEDQNYLNRYSVIDLPKHMKDIILKDSELLNLNKKLFSIDIEEILEC